MKMDFPQLLSNCKSHLGLSISRVICPSMKNYSVDGGLQCLEQISELCQDDGGRGSGETVHHGIEKMDVSGYRVPDY